MTDSTPGSAALSVAEQIERNHATGDYRRCPGNLRHWFVYRGWVGSSSPTCVRCEAPNPSYRPADDPFREVKP